MPAAPVEEPKPSTVEQIICAWPFGLVAVGGLIGGALGGAAYGLNMLAWKKGLRGPALIGVSVATGGVAIVGWLVLAGMIQNAL